MKKIVAALLLAVFAAVATPQAGGAAETAVAALAVVNINTATTEELTTLPGIGQVTAERIVDFRTKTGRFNSADELTQVKGIGEKTLEKIREQIVVE